MPLFNPSNTLDRAYNEGGPGVGRTINAGSGAVVIEATIDQGAASVLELKSDVAATGILDQRSPAMSLVSRLGAGDTLHTWQLQTLPSAEDTRELGIYYNAVRQVRFGISGDVEMTSAVLDGGAGNDAFLSSESGSAAAISAANTGRIRYNQATQKWQVSENTGAYVDMVGAAGGLNIGDAIGGGTATHVLYEDGANQLAQDPQFFFDTALNRVGAQGVQMNNESIFSQAGWMIFQQGLSSKMIMESTSLRPSATNVMHLGRSDGLANWSTLHVATGIKMYGTATLWLDADNDTSIRSPSDDIITFEAGAADVLEIGGGGTTGYLEMGLGQTAAVSAANKGRLRYNESTNKWQYSENTGAYADAFGVGGTHVLATSPTDITATAVPYAKLGGGGLAEGGLVYDSTASFGFSKFGVTLNAVLGGRQMSMAWINGFLCELSGGGAQIGLTFSSGTVDLLIDQFKNVTYQDFVSVSSVYSIGSASQPFGWGHLVTGLDLHGTGRIDFDADNDTSIRSPSDDLITYEVGAVDLYTMDSTSFNVLRTAISNSTADADIGLHLDNSTAAVADVGADDGQQWSSMLVLEGQGWKTDAVAASQEVQFAQQVQTHQGAANPAGEWHLYSNVNDAGWTSLMNLDDSGTLTLSLGGFIVDAGLARFDGDGTDVFELPADATDPTGGGAAAAGRVPVKIGGVTKYLAYY